MYNLVQKKGIVRVVRDMNIRVGAPLLKAQAILVLKGTVFSVTEYITDGYEVSGNAIWYKNNEGNYLWSGNVEFIDEEIISKKILHAPLAHLICTQEFGERPEVYKNYGSPKGHNGLDFRTWVDNNPSNCEQPVFSVFDGVVSESAYETKYKGNYIRIKHSNGYESVYLHLSKRSVENGRQVNAGEEIGISGNSGGASEALHLHFGYRPIQSDNNNGYMGYISPLELFVDEIKFV